MERRAGAGVLTALTRVSIIFVSLVILIFFFSLVFFGFDVDVWQFNRISQFIPKQFPVSFLTPPAGESSHIKVRVA